MGDVLRGRSTREDVGDVPRDTYRRPCFGCGRPIKRSRRHSYCGSKCRLYATRPGPRRFAYADELVDVFPGSGAVGEAWRAWSSQMQLDVESSEAVG